jgi:hypothetical protein
LISKPGGITPFRKLPLKERRQDLNLTRIFAEETDRSANPALKGQGKIDAADPRRLFAPRAKIV